MHIKLSLISALPKYKIYSFISYSFEIIKHTFTLIVHLGLTLTRRISDIEV